MSIGIDFGIGIDEIHGIGLVSYRSQKSWYRPSLLSRCFLELTQD